ncbi:MAG: SixA phosphatase family protein [Chloroflexota bacterium]|jgi:phosphohistidine phosphatase
MELYLLRHGIAEDHSESGHDAHRVLTAAGIRQINHTALVMQILKIQLDAIITSPLYRTRQTADIIGHSYQISPIVDERVSPGFEVNAMQQIVQQVRRPRVLIVGHEPDLGWMVTATTNQRVSVSRASLIRLDGEPGRWQLGFHLSPQAQAALVKFS